MELIEKYLAAWNTTGATARQALIDEVWAADGTYPDPLATVAGRDQLDALITGVQQQFAGVHGFLDRVPA